MSVSARRVLVVLLVAMTMKVPIDAQAPAPRRADGVDTSGVTAVVVDLIVRDLSLIHI